MEMKSVDFLILGLFFLAGFASSKQNLHLIFVFDCYVLEMERLTQFSLRLWFV